MAQADGLYVRAKPFGPFNTTRSVNPIVVIARAAEPMLPGTAGSTRMTVTLAR